MVEYMLQVLCLTSLVELAVFAEQNSLHMVSNVPSVLCEEENEVFSQLGVSRIECAAVCSQHLACVSWAYDTSQHICRECNRTYHGTMSTDPGTIQYKVSMDCPSGWTFFNDFCYYIGTTMMTFNDTWDSCRLNNSYLAYIENEAENTFVKGLLQQYPDMAFWLSLNDMETEGTFVWYGSVSDSLYRDFGPGEPSNTGGLEHCVEMSSLFWNDIVCDDLNGHICKKLLLREH